MTAIIQINNLTQVIQDRKVIDDISLAVEVGDIFGLVGPNGAGKTTLIRIMTTLLTPTHGEVWIDGHSVRSSPESVRRVIGYIPDQYGFYSDMTTWEYLDFFGACYKIHSDERFELISSLLELVDLSIHKNVQVDNLSLGMKQRLSLARVLLHDPKLLILDDPFSGLDPYARDEFQELLGELARMGKTIFFSSHILADVAKICNRVGIMEAGKLVAYGSIQGLKDQLNLAKTIQIKVQGQAKDVSSMLEDFPYDLDFSIEEANDEETLSTVQVRFQGDDEVVSKLLSTLVQSGARVLNFSVDTNDIESIFTQVTKGAVS